MKSVLMSTLLMGLSFVSVAHAGADGTYVMDGGAYSINVEFTADGIQIVEPNKTSVYKATGGNEYQFTNLTNGITYGLRVVDDETIEAFKPGSAQPSTTLKRRAEFTVSTEANPDASKYEALAEKYMTLAQSDADNVHVWAACGAAALGWSTLSADQARSMASQSAAMLKPIMTSTGSSPCPEAIPNDVW